MESIADEDALANSSDFYCCIRYRDHFHRDDRCRGDHIALLVLDYCDQIISSNRGDAACQLLPVYVDWVNVVVCCIQQLLFTQ